MKFWLLLLGALLLTPGCVGTGKPAGNPLEYTENAERAYEDALEDYFDRNWERLVPKMEAITREFAYSRYARLAELRIADARFEQDKLPEAIAGYKSYVQDYANDPEVPYARYKITLAQFDGARDNVMLPPLEERDLAQVVDAYRSILAYQRDYPDSKHQRELSYMLEIVEGMLVRHELYVARYYSREGRFEAAAKRASYALRNFPGSEMIPEALVLLGEIRMKQSKDEDARVAFQTVLEQHPSSAFTRSARRFLAKLEAEAKRAE